tara:strand:- start:6069 stop:7610 length:1542 start_codon:yes stop_codon:yes gene_type:complete
MLNYIIQVILFQTLFLSVYDLFLSKETFFTKNRWYLLSTPLVAFLLPFIKIPTIQKIVPQEFSIVLPEIILSPQSFIEQTETYQSINYFDLFFIAGFIIFLIVFLIKLFKIISLIRNNSLENKDSYKLILLPKSKKAFSFFNYIFLGNNISVSDREQIVAHEMIHCKQKHTYDLLYFEFLKIVMWFNPLLYIYQKRIAAVHEYITDAEVVKFNPKEMYVNKLINDLFDVENILFVNQFYKHSLIKKRIIMITKEKSKQIMQAKYLLLIPVLASMLFYVSCSENIQLEEEAVAKKQEITFYGSYFNSEGSGGKSIETYLDRYYNKALPDFGVEIALDKLLEEEKFEFESYKEKHDNLGLSAFTKEMKIYKLETGRKMIVVVWDFSMYKSDEKTETIKFKNGVPFTMLDKVPTFPGCPDNDGKCFNKKMQQHFVNNFDSKLANELGLKSGKKRLIILFRIDKKGFVTDIKAKAPHKTLKLEAIRVIKLLPKMNPGEQDGEIVDVKYTLPVRIDVK